MEQVMLRALLYSFIFLRLMVLASASSAIMPGCVTECGNVSIYYPFGVGDRRCFKDPGHELFCNRTYNPPLLFLTPKSNFPVTNIELDGQLTITVPVTYDCSNSTREKFDPKLHIALGDVYTFSYTRNKFTVVGCDARAFIKKPNSKQLFGGCVSMCLNTSSLHNQSCSGIGCSETSIPKKLTALDIAVSSFHGHKYCSSFSPCSYAFLAEKNWYKFHKTDLLNFRNSEGMIFQNKTMAPVVLDWVAGTESCKMVRRNGTASSCGDNSVCVNSDNGPGHRCHCKQGYEGNPYLSHGCQDIDECKNRTKYPCEGICINTPGNFSCTCPPGTASTDNLHCVPLHKQFPVLQFSLGFGFSLMFVAVAGSSTYKGFQRRKLIKLRQKFFIQNGGFLLQEQVSKHPQAVETTRIYTADELQQATNNYSESRVLGEGAHGTVYKGILPDERVVAIKKSKIVDKSQTEQFINEVVILSQIHHKYVVKLLGCCLETEVPLLVYEFITNGTLYFHIQSKEFSLSWDQRLRIAIEAAEALGYLHSAASPPIIHRDIKSANILLDNNYNAKISDFGASRLVPIDHTQVPTLVQGTLGYLDPEYFLTSQLTEKSDVYSFGVVLVELLTGKKAVSFERPELERNLAMHFASCEMEINFHKMLDKRILINGSIEQIQRVAELAQRCLKMNGKDRPTMKEVAAELEYIRKGRIRRWSNQGSILVTSYSFRHALDSQNYTSAVYKCLKRQPLFEMELGR